MRKRIGYLYLVISFLVPQINAQDNDTLRFYDENGIKIVVDDRIDSQGYWKKMAARGLAEFAPDVLAPPAKYTSSKIKSKTVKTGDSPDIPVTETESYQSENSIFINPNDTENLVNSNNSATSQIWGANEFHSTNGGITWDGIVEGVAGNNSGDPAVAIGNNGWYYNGHIHLNGGQGIAISQDSGTTWTEVVVSTLEFSSPFSLLDKNHLWIDNSVSSPFEGYLYDSWTAMGPGETNDGQIEIKRSADGGYTWSNAVEISSELDAGSHNQGVNIQTGPNGEVYAVWAIYDSWPSDEAALGFARSTDSAFTFTSSRIIDDIRGIRSTGISKNMRVNSFPVMAVDISGGPFNGNIYVVWTNMGVPGENDGSWTDIYFIKSTDLGNTWSDPKKVNQDNSTTSIQYLPWITCDPVTGTLSVIFYDDRNVGGPAVETWVANSFDAGESWDDFKVSDVSFTPAPIPESADNYFGDYLAISAKSGTVYPCWTDNRTGSAMTYISPFETGPLPGQAYVVFFGLEINDTATNNTATLDYGETVGLDFTVRNFGDTMATDVIATISTNNPYIEIIDDTEIYDQIDVLELQTINNAFTIKASDNIPDGENVAFVMSAEDGDSTWISEFSVKAHAPKLQAGNLIIDDIYGNVDGILNVGETSLIKIESSNTGSFITGNCVAWLSTTHDNVIVDSDTYFIEDIEAGNSAEAVFLISIADEITDIDHIEFVYSIRAREYSAYNYYIKPIGIVNPQEDFESGDLTTYNWENNSEVPWYIDIENAFEGEFSLRSGDIADNEETEISLTLNLVEYDSISFYVKVSSENLADVIKFYVDDVEKGRWSGTNDWSANQYYLTRGEHTFEWKYIKDFSFSSGSDCAWIDNISIPQSAVTDSVLKVDAVAVNPVVCPGNSTNLLAMAYGGKEEYTYSWAPAEAMDDNLIMNPAVLPTETTNYLVIVSSGDQTENDMVSVSIDESSINLGNNQVVYYGETNLLELNGSYMSYLWNDGSTLSSYLVNPNNYEGNSADIWLEVINENGCVLRDTIHVDFWISEADDIQSMNNKITIGPNPASDYISISNAKNSKLQIYNIHGELILKRRKLDYNCTVDISDLLPGTYIVEIVSKDITSIEKLVITK
ncbi:T9SS type A sorting domain-containing protein [Bacteroidota bacterium]